MKRYILKLKENNFWIFLIISIIFHFILLSAMKIREGGLYTGSRKEARGVQLISIIQQPETTEGEEIELNKITEETGNGTTNIKRFFSINDVTIPPKFLYQIKPEYPEGARINGIEAEVIAEVKIDENGNIKDIRIIKTGGFGFDEAVIKALQKSKFSPAIKDGKPVPVTVKIPFRFKIE